MISAKCGSSRVSPATIGKNEVERGRAAGSVAEGPAATRHAGPRKGALAMLIALIAAAFVFDIFWWLRR
jgi:hypothetical protein